MTADATNAFSMDMVKPASDARAWHGIALGLICLAALFLRLHALGHPSLWYDEYTTVVDAQGHMVDFSALPRGVIIDPPDLLSPSHARPILEVLRSPDIAAPLHPIILRYWCYLFGQTDVQARMPSVLASMLAIVFLFDLVRTLTATADALWACAIMAVAQPHIQYAQEARSYALLLAIGLAASAALARLHRFGYSLPRAFALGAAVAGMLLAHYFAIGPLAGLAAWSAIYLRGRALRAAIVSTCIAGLLFIAFLQIQPTSKAAGLAAKASWLGEDSHGHVTRTAWRIANMPSQFLYATPSDGAPWPAIASIAFVLPFVLRRQRPAMLWCGFYLASGVGLIAAVDLWRTTSAADHIRYVLVVSPAFYLLLVLAIPRGPARRLIPAIAIVGCLAAIPEAYYNDWKGQWRELGADVQRFTAHGDILIFPREPTVFISDPSGAFEGVAFYAHIPCQVLLLDQPPSQALLSEISSYRHIWLVSPGLSGNPETTFPDWNARRAGGRWLNAGVLYEIMPTKS